MSMQLIVRVAQPEVVVDGTVSCNMSYLDIFTFGNMLADINHNSWQNLFSVVQLQ